MEEEKVVRTGWMKKKGHKANMWGDRYFVLKGNSLYYYLKQSDTEPKGIITLHHLCKVSEVKTNPTKKQKQFLFRIVWPEDESEEAKKKNDPSKSWSGLLYSSVFGQQSNDSVQFDAINDKEKSLVFACEKYIDAEKWANAIQIQIQNISNFGTGNTKNSQTNAPPPDVRLTDVEEWVKSSKWKVYSVSSGIRVFSHESAECFAVDSKLFQRLLYNFFFTPKNKFIPPCLRINIPINTSVNDVFMKIMNYPPGCRTGIIKNVRVVEYIDNCTDIIHIVLDPVYIFPTWTAPRDFCLMRYWRQNSDGSFIICLDSTVHSDCPLCVDYIRAEMHAAYIISPAKDSTNIGDDEQSECMLTFIAQMDSRGWIWREFDYPNMMLQALMMHVLDIRDNIDVERFVQAHFDPTNEERKAVSRNQPSSSSSASSPTKGELGLIPPSLLPPETWTDIDASTFRVRGVSYLLDKVKSISAPALFKLVAVDLFEVNEPMQNICSHPRNRVAMALQRGDPSWVFVLNIMVPGPPFLSFVAYFEGDPALIEQDTPFGRIAKKFFHGNDDEFRNNRFKLIPKIIDGNMLIKMAVKDTPALLGNKLKQYYHKVDVDVGSSSIARNVVGLAIGYSKAIVVDMALCLQGDEENELPEVIMGGCTCIHVDCAKAKKL